LGKRDRGGYLGKNKLGVVNPMCVSWRHLFPLVKGERKQHGATLGDEKLKVAGKKKGKI